MEAKDTVKTRSELVTYCQHKFGGNFKPSEQDLREAQAEISFKAGIKEVQEFIRQEYHIGLHLDPTWQSKLKEWGIDKEVEDVRDEM